MPYSLDGRLVIAISSRALFDLDTENNLFDKDGDERAYMEHQQRNEESPLAPGVSLPFIKQLLGLNDLCQLKTVHVAVDLLGMLVESFTKMMTLMTIKSDGRKGLIHSLPQKGKFSGCSIGNSTNHRVQFYDKLEEIHDKGRDADLIARIEDHLREVWQGWDPEAVTRIEFQFKDLLGSEELNRLGLKVMNARDWHQHYKDIMSYYCRSKFAVYVNERLIDVHPVWTVICDLWLQMGIGMVSRHANPVGLHGQGGTTSGSGPGPSIPLISVQPRVNPPPSSLPRSKIAASRSAATLAASGGRS